MKFFSITLLMLALASAANWAVLVCGSSGYGNYRHHADIAHAYQIMKAGGLEPDHVVTMMYNDVPTASSNPFPGKLYNHPGDDVPDVYEGVVVDYEGKTVAPEILVKVLTGDESAGGKVLKTTEADNVFLFFSDHGGPDIIALPGGYLHSADLLGAITTMHEKKMYNKFVLYIEACYSGSMFLQLPENLNVLAVTAANDKESSWGWYCGSEAVVKGKTLGTCLGDEFSVFWMEDADKGEQKTETLEEQWNRIKAGVTKSHASRYGDVSFSQDMIGEFIGYPAMKNPVEYKRSFETWDSRDNELLFRQYMAEHTTGREQTKWQALYKEEIENRHEIDMYFESIAKEAKYYQRANVKNVDCYKSALAQYDKIMGKSDYALKYFDVFANMCNENPLAFSKY